MKKIEYLQTKGVFNEMREESFFLSETQLMKSIGGWLYAQAPKHSPRKVEVIMQKVQETFREQAFNDNEYYSIRIPVKDDGLKKYLHNLLFSIDEFKELNLSQNEYDNGVDVEDDSRPKFHFTSSHDVYNSESWKEDIVDLDAFVQNVTRDIKIAQDIEEDCFGCVHENTEVCNKCMVNEKLTNLYEAERKPKGRFTMACKYDCFRSFYICCKECSQKDKCPNKCDASPETCGLNIVKNNKKVKEV